VITMNRRLRTVLPLLLVAAFVSACTIVVDTPATRSTSAFKTAEAAFHILIERHVDKPGSPQLLNAALDSAVAQLKKDGVGDPVLNRPEFTGSTESDFAKFSTALDGLLQQYPAETAVTLERAATDGMAKSMNECHTYYLDPERAKGFNQPPVEYSGIGAQLSANGPNDVPEITVVFPNSPAEKAGVKAGDKIKTVNGAEMKGLTAEEVANKIKGPDGTTVELVLVRAGVEMPFSIVRGKILPPRVIDQIDDGNIGFISVSALNGDVANQVSTAVKRQNAAGVVGRILDLRNDPGGDLSAAVDIASIFMKSSTLVYQVGRDGQRQALRTSDRWYVPETKPLVVLVNKNSASGSEIIAAGVRANGTGLVMGTQTAGCVGIGQPREMPDGGLLLVTLARMQDAKTGEELNGNGRGVVPDKKVEQDPTTPGDAQRVAADTYLKATGRTG
jgi:carboxyl-terminal processing protease